MPSHPYIHRKYVYHMYLITAIVWMQMKEWNGYNEQGLTTLATMQNTHERLLLLASPQSIGVLHIFNDNDNNIQHALVVKHQQILEELLQNLYAIL